MITFDSLKKGWVPMREAYPPEGRKVLVQHRSGFRAYAARKGTIMQVLLYPQMKWRLENCVRWCEVIFQ